MLVLLAFIIIFHITSAALLFIATIDNVSPLSTDRPQAPDPAGSSGIASSPEVIRLLSSLPGRTCPFARPRPAGPALSVRVQNVPYLGLGGQEPVPFVLDSATEPGVTPWL